MTQFPQINLNGTSGPELQEQYSNAVTAVHDAIRAVRKTSPHGRDYQTLTGNEASVAMTEHLVRLRKLEDVWEELENIWLNVGTQNEGRSKS